MAEEDRDIRRYLVLVVGLLAGPGAGEELYRLSRREPSRFYLLVPATKPEYGWTWSEGQALADATQRLELMLEFTGKLGMQVDGLVYPQAEPVEAVRKAVASAEAPFDGLIVIDRPKGHAQRWMAANSLKAARRGSGTPDHAPRGQPSHGPGEGLRSRRKPPAVRRVAPRSRRSVALVLFG